MKKRGQITIFIIIAIVVVAIIGTLVYVNTSQAGLSKRFFGSSEIKPTIDVIQSSILDCADTVTEDSLVVIGIQGGYYEEPREYFDLEWTFIPYYYLEGEFLMPKITTIENELSKAVDENFASCLDQFSFPGFNLDYARSTTDTTIKEKEVVFEIDIPINIEKDDNIITFELKDHPVTQPSYLFGILEVANYITESHREDPELICINCVADMARERDLFVDMIDFEETETLIVISENKTASAPYIFEFLNKYPADQ